MKQLFQRKEQDVLGMYLGLVHRVEVLEERVFKNKKRKTTLYQQILMLDHLGMLDKIYQLDIPNTKKADLLAVLLNTDPSNTKKALEGLPKKDSQLRNGYNFDFLVEMFESVGLQKLAARARKTLKEIDGL